MIGFCCTVILASMVIVGREVERGRWGSAARWFGVGLIAALAVNAQLPDFPPYIPPACPDDVPSACPR